MKKLSRKSAVVLSVAAAMAGHATGAFGVLVNDSWNGASSTWSNAAGWNTFPQQYQGTYPDNTPGISRSVWIYTGNVTLDVDATISALTLGQSAQILGGGHTLTVESTFDWEGGYIGNTLGAPTINMFAGSNVTLAAPSQNGSSYPRLLWGTVNAYGTTDYSGGGPLYVNNGASYNNYGTFNFSAASISHSFGTGTIANVGTFNKTGTFAATIDANMANSGAFNLSTGSLKLEQVTNSAGGVISYAAGTTLQLDATSDYQAGSDLVGAGSLQFSFGTHNFAAGTFHPTGPVSIASSATVNVKNAITPSSLGTIAGTFNTDVDQSFSDVTLSGRIGGPGTVTMHGGFTWATGTLDRVSANVNGHFALASDAQGVIQNSTTVTSFRVIDNAGTITHQGNSLYLNSGGVLNNSGVFYAAGTGGILTTFAPGTLNNSGTFDLIANVPYKIAVPFNNTGTVNVDAGTLTFTNTGSNAGAFVIHSGATLELQTPMTHLAGSSVSGAGNLLFSSGANDMTLTNVATSGSLTVGTNSTVTFGNVFTPAGTVNVAGTMVLNTTAGSTEDQLYADLAYTGGGIGGSRNVVVTHHLDWSGNSTATSGTGHLVITSGATADLSGSVKNVQKVIDNAGTMTLDSTTLYLNVNSALNNTGTLSLLGTTAVQNNNGQGPLNNSGTLHKQGDGTVTISVPLNNTGTATVDGGSLTLSGTGSNKGQIALASGSTLRFNSVLAHQTGSSITGAGSLEFLSGNNDLTLSKVTTTGTLSIASNAGATFGNVISPTGVLNSFGNFYLNTTPGSTAEQVFDQVSLSGTFGGSRDVRITGHLGWTGSATATGTGRLTIAPGAIADLDGSSKSVYRPVDIYGTLNHNAGQLALNAGGVMTNYGTFNAQATQGIVATSGTGSFINNGTFNKTGTGAFPIQVSFTNAAGGTLNLNGGSLQLMTGSNAGAFVLAAGTTLTYAGNYTHNPTSSVTGPGSVVFASGTHVFPAGTFDPKGSVTFGNQATVTINNTITPASVGIIDGTVNFNANQSFADVTQQGDIGGSGNLTFSGAFTWCDSTMSGAGKTTLSAGASWVMTNSSGRTLTRSLDSYADATYASGLLYIGSGAVLSNRGSFTASAPNGFTTTTGNGTFNNVGTFTKAGTTTFAIPSGIPLNNSGIVNVNQGVLQISGGGTSTGTITVASGGTLKFDTNSYIYGATSSLAGGGNVDFSGGTHAFPAGAFALGGLLNVGSQANVTINNDTDAAILPISGSLTLNAPHDFYDDLTLNNNGTLAGNSPFNFYSTFFFKGGTLGGTGTATIHVGAVLDMSGSAQRTISRPLVVGGTATYSAGQLLLGGTYFQVSSALNVTGSGPLAWSSVNGTNNNSLLVTGVLNVDMGTPASEWQISGGLKLDSIGIVNVQQGKMSLFTQPAQLNSAGVLTAGTWNVFNNGNLNFAAGPTLTTIGAGTTVTVDGAGAKFDKLNTLTTNNGGFNLQNGRAFTTAGAFANNGYLVLSGGASISFAGATTNTAMLYLSPNTTGTASALFTSNGGTLSVDVGSVFNIKGGISAPAGILQINGTVDHLGGDSTIGNDQRWTDGSQLNVTGGTLTLTSDAGAFFPNPTLAVTAGGTGTIKGAGWQRWKSITVNDGGVAGVASGSPTPSVLLTRSLTINGTGKVDVADGRLVVDYDPAGGSVIDTVRQQLLAGSIISSVAQADAQQRKGIGYAEISQLDTNSWGGMLLDNSAVVMRMTWIGDANLNGRIDQDDYTLLDRGFRRGYAGWINGDFNYDNVIDQADYLLIDRVFAQQIGGLDASLIAQRHSQFGADYVAALVASVPEPVSCAWVVACGLLARRRRTRRAAPAGSSEETTHQSPTTGDAPASAVAG